MKAEQKATHTPGPWQAVDTGHDEWEIQSRHGLIAITSVNRPQFEANARLIAAAPELLEACKGLIVLHEYVGEHRPEINNKQAHHAKITARAAVAKATGETR